MSAPETATNVPADQVEAPTEAPANGTAAAAAPSAEAAPEAAGEPSGTTAPATSQPHSASLYVGELDPSVTEAMLYELFSSIGQVASIRVCRDAVTRRSLGYAYVNYNNTADGERALEDLNYTLIKGRPCRIMWSQRDPALRKTGQGNVFIKNLDTAIDNKALHDTFAAFGNILSCKVAQDEYGNSKGYGFVHYETAEAATNAIKHVNGMLLNEKKVFVGHHIAKKDRQSKFEEMKANFTNIYVKNVEQDVTDEEFRGLFEKYGEITSATLSRDNETGKSRGFGFVNFSDHEAASAAVEALNEYELKGQKLYVGRAQKKHEREEELRKQYEAARIEKASKYQGVNLYIKNLSDDIDDEKLRELFSSYGNITSAKVMREAIVDAPAEAEKDKEADKEKAKKEAGDKSEEKGEAKSESEDKSKSEEKTEGKTESAKPEKKHLGKSKGFGFVCFSNPDEASKAVTEMNQRMVHGKPLYVALAQRKDVRKSQLETPSANSKLLLPPEWRNPSCSLPSSMAHLASKASSPVLSVECSLLVKLVWVMPGMPSGRPGQFPQFPGQQGGRAPGQGGIHAMKQPLRSIILAVFNAAPESQQKQMLGEAIYPKILAQQPELAGKITGMLLEMDNSELIGLVDDDVALRAKVDEALTVYDEYVKNKNDAPAGEAAQPEAGKPAEETKS
ncbi:polyadenylate-binding protein [Trichophyton tonsurans CBS 112818]|uniref:Polyadenylate-binding protein n=1 Tax=Trichophyton tonsurans (strain CBS 112818) TaxID=647933 RepID=F2S4S0_TRIT1|nr:polyadenylate-binding protein [Trichophyton tonsurans CBS 112818]